jgi:hypothetical protein
MSTAQHIDRTRFFNLMRSGYNHFIGNYAILLKDGASASDMRIQKLATKSHVLSKTNKVPAYFEGIA